MSCSIFNSVGKLWQLLIELSNWNSWKTFIFFIVHFRNQLNQLWVLLFFLLFFYDLMLCCLATSSTSFYGKPNDLNLLLKKLSILIRFGNCRMCPFFSFFYKEILCRLRILVIIQFSKVWKEFLLKNYIKYIKIRLSKNIWKFLTYY